MHARACTGRCRHPLHRCVVEAKNEKDEMLGFERLEQIVQSHAPQAGAQDIAGHIQSRVEQFVGRMAQQDDITIVVVRVN